jgi:VWFA-related protein
MPRRSLAVGVSLMCALAIGAAQQPPAPSAETTPSFRSGVSYVELDASVLDRDRNPVRGLSASDFTVLEDGRPQRILSFSEINIPDSAPAGSVREVAPAVQATDEAMQRRLVVILLDDGQSPVGRPEENRTKEVAKMIVDQLRPADLAAVYFTRLHTGAQDFTSDHAKLQAAIDTFVPFRSPIDSRDVEYNDYILRNSFDRIQTIAKALSALPGRRKALFYFGVGVRMPNPNKVLEFAQLTQIFRDAQRANLNIFPIDPSGLTGLDDFGATESGLPPSRRPTDASASEFYRTVAENTGGLAIVNRNDFKTVVPRVLRENGAYYLLGYESPNVKADGRLRRITVRVNRRGVTVRARSGYYGARADIPTKATVAPVAPTATSPAKVASNPELDQVLTRMAAYLAAYAEQYSSTIATEHYTQSYGRGVNFRQRTLQAEFGIVRLPGHQWLAFRDVTHVDGKAIADREGRLATLFQNPSADALKRADAITEESTRFNVGPIRRTVNNPAIVLDALDGRNQSRFRFSKDGEETLDGTRVWRLRFTEQARPTFIRTFNDEDAALVGRAWVDPIAGRPLRVEITIPGLAMSGQAGTIRFAATINVTFHEDQRLRLWVPATMTERYDGSGNAGEIAAGNARYTDYRRFGVEIKEELAK